MNYMKDEVYNTIPFLSLKIYIHTHTNIYIYTYIYIFQKIFCYGAKLALNSCSSCYSPSIGTHIF